MELKLDPSILKILLGANPKLQFLNDSLSYDPDERPTATILSRRLTQLSTESMSYLCFCESQSESKNVLKLIVVHWGFT